MESYEKLIKSQHEIYVLSSVEGLIEWDMETYMPPKGVSIRGEQMALLATLVHERTTSPEIGKLLDEIKKNKEYDKLNDVQKRNVYLIEKEYLREVNVPTELASEIANEITHATDAWKKAKKKSKYAIFRPNLEKLLELNIKKANLIDSKKEPFDVFLDELEPGMTSDQLTSLFDKLKKKLVPILNKCLDAPNQPDLSLIYRPCPAEIQRKMALELAELVGYDLEAGRIDETVHPFTGGYFDDVRITTHIYPKNFSSSFYSILHEAGHGIYEQNINHEWIYQPVGLSTSMGIHESQSRFYENMIGRSLEFWTYYLPHLKKLTKKTFTDVELEPFVLAMATVRPSKVRTEADEVTYCLHIILRFEIERDMLAGKISLDELPNVWNQKMDEYLGVKIENDAEGVLQDVHWSNGLFGYFPSYALGNIISAQFLSKIKHDLPDFSQLLMKGKITPITTWLKEKVHIQGNLYDPNDLIKRVTGHNLDIADYINYLEEKYSKIYGF